MTNSDQVVGSVYFTKDLSKFKRIKTNRPLKDRYKKIGESKFNEKLYLTLRDQFGSVIEESISEGLNIVHDLGLNENDFRDKLDLIFNDSEIFDGAYDSWIGISPNVESLELNRGHKNWWSRKKADKD